MKCCMTSYLSNEIRSAVMAMETRVRISNPPRLVQISIKRTNINGCYESFESLLCGLTFDLSLGMYFWAPTAIKMLISCKTSLVQMDSMEKMLTSGIYIPKQTERGSVQFLGGVRRQRAPKRLCDWLRETFRSVLADKLNRVYIECIGTQEKCYDVSSKILELLRPTPPILLRLLYLLCYRSVKI